MPRQADLFPAKTAHPRLPGEGYAGTPGTGPRGETCKTCDHLTCHERHTGGRARRWYKCSLVKVRFSAVTDIRLDAPACHQWAPSTDQQP